MNMNTKLENLITMQEAADVAGFTLGSLRVLACHGAFITPDRKLGGMNLYARKRVQAWKAERERRKRRPTK
jgi:hypothetical protein